MMKQMVKTNINEQTQYLCNNLTLTLEIQFVLFILFHFTTIQTIQNNEIVAKKKVFPYQLSETLMSETFP